jgi:hypothetical protein
MQIEVALNLAKDFLRKKLSNDVWFGLANLKRYLIKRDYSERVVTNSQEEKPLYFIIRREPPGAGLFSNINHVLQGLRESENRGLIPVVDMQNYWSSYSLSTPIHGTQNSWEYFFDQPAEFSLQTALNSNQYVLSKGNRIAGDHWLTQKSLQYATDPEKIAEISRLLRKYLKLNRFTQSTIEFVKKNTDWKPDLNLGVSLRGSDYLEIKPHGHPMQPSLQEVCDAIEENLGFERDTRIFLACEDMTIRSTIENRFPGIVLQNFRTAPYFKEYIAQELKLSGRNLSIMTNNLGYLVEILLFSECKSCVSSLANGSAIGIALNNGRFRSKKILSPGVY